MDRGRWDRGPRFVKGLISLPQGVFRSHIVPFGACFFFQLPYSGFAVTTVVGGSIRLATKAARRSYRAAAAESPCISH